MARSRDPDEHRPESAMVLRTKDVMGRAEQTELQSNLVELPAESPASASYQMLPTAKAVPRQDVYESDSLLFRFSVRPTLELDGQLVLEVLVAPHAADPHAQLTCHRVSLATGDRIGVRLSLDETRDIRFRWGYSRRAGMRRVCTSEYDDPKSATEHSTFHVTWLSPQPVRLKPSVHAQESQAAADDLFIELTPQQQQQIHTIDHCELVLDRLNEEISSSTEFLRWPIQRFSRDTLDRAVAGLDFRVNILVRRGQDEWVWGKRVRPTIQYPISLVQNDILQSCATIGVSLDEG